MLSSRWTLRLKLSRDSELRVPVLPNLFLTIAFYFSPSPQYDGGGVLRAVRYIACESWASYPGLPRTPVKECEDPLVTQLRNYCDPHWGRCPPKKGSKRLSRFPWSATACLHSTMEGYSSCRRVSPVANGPLA